MHSLRLLTNTGPPIEAPLRSMKHSTRYDLPWAVTNVWPSEAGQLSAVDDGVGVLDVDDGVGVLDVVDAGALSLLAP